ncbi:MAG: peptidoglycan-binding protein [bacterium]|nr:peptidoglycan-binding protein [bacterium]
MAALQKSLEAKGFLVMPSGLAYGYFGSLTQKAVVAYQKSVSLDPVGVVGPQTRAALAKASVTAETTTASASASGGAVFVRTLKTGSEGTDVTKLQEILVAKGFLTMPQGVAYGYFGQMTRKALAAYQGSIGLSAVGELGPQTRASLNASAVVSATPAPTKTQAMNTSSASIFTRTLVVGSEGTDVAKLQEILVAKGFLTMPQGVAYGYFGGATKAAVTAYQTSLGLEGVGIVGPQTRSKLNENN